MEIDEGLDGLVTGGGVDPSKIGSGKSLLAGSDSSKPVSRKRQKLELSGEIEPLGSSSLTNKQRVFARVYAETDGNAKEALFVAGYHKNVSAAMVLESPAVKEEIERINSLRHKNSVVNNAWLLDKYVTVLERCMQVEPVRDKNGKPTGLFKSDNSNAIKALDSIAKHLGFNEADNRQKASVSTTNIQNNSMKGLTFEEIKLMRELRQKIERSSSGSEGADLIE